MGFNVQFLMLFSQSNLQLVFFVCYNLLYYNNIQLQIFNYYYYNHLKCQLSYPQNLIDLWNKVVLYIKYIKTYFQRLYLELRLRIMFVLFNILFNIIFNNLLFFLI